MSVCVCHYIQLETVTSDVHRKPTLQMAKTLYTHSLAHTHHNFISYAISVSTAQTLNFSFLYWLKCNKSTCKKFFLSKYLPFRVSARACATRKIQSGAQQTVCVCGSGIKCKHKSRNSQHSLTSISANIVNVHTKHNLMEEKKIRKEENEKGRVIGRNDKWTSDAKPSRQKKMKKTISMSTSMNTTLHMHTIALDQMHKTQMRAHTNTHASSVEIVNDMTIYCYYYEYWNGFGLKCSKRETHQRSDIASIAQTVAAVVTIALRLITVHTHMYQVWAEPMLMMLQECSSFFCFVKYVVAPGSHFVFYKWMQRQQQPTRNNCGNNNNNRRSFNVLFECHLNYFVDYFFFSFCFFSFLIISFACLLLCAWMERTSSILCFWMMCVVCAERLFKFVDKKWPHFSGNRNKLFFSLCRCFSLTPVALSKCVTFCNWLWMSRFFCSCYLVQSWLP